MNWLQPIARSTRKRTRRQAANEMNHLPTTNDAPPSNILHLTSGILGDRCKMLDDAPPTTADALITPTGMDVDETATTNNNCNMNMNESGDEPSHLDHLPSHALEEAGAAAGDADGDELSNILHLSPKMGDESSNTYIYKAKMKMLDGDESSNISHLSPEMPGDESDEVTVEPARKKSKTTTTKKKKGGDRKSPEAKLTPSEIPNRGRKAKSNTAAGNKRTNQSSETESPIDPPPITKPPILPLPRPLPLPLPSDDISPTVNDDEPGSHEQPVPIYHARTTSHEPMVDSLGGDTACAPPVGRNESEQKELIGTNHGLPVQNDASASLRSLVEDAKLNLTESTTQSPPPASSTQCRTSTNSASSLDLAQDTPTRTLSPTLRTPRAQSHSSSILITPLKPIVPPPTSAAASPKISLSPSPPLSHMSVLLTPQMSSTNHLAKTSSALKARLSKSRGRPSLLTVGNNNNTHAADSTTTTTTTARVPWTVMAAAAAAAAETNKTTATSSSPTASSISSPPHLADPSTNSPSLSSPLIVSTESKNVSTEPHTLTNSNKSVGSQKRKSLLTPISKSIHSTTHTTQSLARSLTTIDRLKLELRDKHEQLHRLREHRTIKIDPLQTTEISRLTEKWTITAQEVLLELLNKVQQTRPVSMSALLHDLGVDPHQVRWNELTSDFE